jgi:prephenate dehydratase
MDCCGERDLREFVLESKAGVDSLFVPAVEVGGEPLKVAIQGELGSNSHMAALAALGEMAQAGPPVEAVLLACGVSAEVFERLENGTATMAVLPIENSLHGSVFEHYDLLLESGIAVVGETLLPIRHNVIAAPGVTLGEVRRVMSHPVALSQCRRWLRAHPEIEVAPFYDTAGSVKQLMASGARDVAGIAPELAARQYGAAVLVPGVEDHRENYTRFYVLVPERALRGDGRWAADANKLSVAFSLEHRPGTLIEALEVFRRAGLNLTKIESRPVPGRPWEYVFFADLRFEDAARLDQALDELRGRCEMVRELGRYRAAETVRG